VSSNRPERVEVLGALNQQMRILSALSVLFSQAIATRVGMNSTDMEAGDILNMTGPITAGRLAELTGLSTGAITGVIDRLEQAGYVRREKDPNDRRRVVIQPVLEKSETEIGPLYESMRRAMAELCARYSDQELAIVLDFFIRASPVVQEVIAKLRGAASPARPPQQSESVKD
jgi:DNA-binding MarR family transcriptional regulator